MAHIYTYSASVCPGWQTRKTSELRNTSGNKSILKKSKFGNTWYAEGIEKLNSFFLQMWSMSYIWGPFSDSYKYLQYHDSIYEKMFVYSNNIYGWMDRKQWAVISAYNLKGSVEGV